MNSNVILRMRDVALCLYHAKQHELVLNKMQLQKIIYLLDCLDAFLYVLLPEEGHQTYYHGPYDKNIQNAADSLVFHLLADVENIKMADNGNIACEYLLTANGVEWVEILLYDDVNTKKRSLIIASLLESLLSRNLLRNIVKLVYSEPVFVRNNRSGYGVSLDFNDLDNNDVFSFMTIVLDSFNENKKMIYVPFICDLLVDYLSKRLTALATTGEEW